MNPEIIEDDFTVFTVQNIANQLEDLLSVGPNVVNNDQKELVMMTSLLHEKMDHLDILYSCTAAHQLNWNYCDNDGFSLLGKTIQQGLKESIRFLLQLPEVNKNQCGVEECGPEYVGPINICITLKDEATLLVILEYPEINVNARFSHGLTALEQAINDPDPIYLRHLVERRPDLDINSRNTHVTALKLAIQLNRVSHLSCLLERPNLKINPDMEGATSRGTPLSEAVAHARVIAVQQLLRYGANPRQRIRITDDDPTLVDLYHFNILQCSTILEPEESFKRVQIGYLLLHAAGLQPADDPHSVREVLEDSLQQPAARGARQWNTALELVHQMRVGPPTLRVLARRAIYDSLRSRCYDEPTASRMNSLIATENLPEACSNFLHFLPAELPPTEFLNSLNLY